MVNSLLTLSGKREKYRYCSNFQRNNFLDIFMYHFLFYGSNIILMIMELVVWHVVF